MTNPNQKPPTDVPKSIEVDDDDCKQPVSSLTLMGEPKSTPKRRKSKKKKRSSEEKSDSKKSLPSPPPLVEEPDEDESKKDATTSEKKLKEGKKKKKEKDDTIRKSIHSTKSNKSSKSNKSEKKKKKKKVASGDIEMAPSTTKRKSKSKIRDLSDKTLDEDFMVEDADDTPSTPKKRKSKSRKKKPNSMMQIDMDGNVQERALKNVYGSESGEPTMPSPKKKSKKKQKRIYTCTDTSNKTLPTAITDISNHSRSMSFSQRSTRSGMEINANPNPYGRAPSYMRSSQRGYPSDEFRSQRGYPSDEFRNCEPLDEHSSHSYRTYNSYDNSYRDSRSFHSTAGNSFYGDEEDQMRYKKSTMDLADTTIRKPKCCLIASGIFFCVMAITITVIIAKKMPQWTGQTRRLEMFFSPHQHNFLRGMRSGAQSLDAEQHRDGSLDDLFYDDERDHASATTSSSPGFLFPF